MYLLLNIFKHGDFPVPFQFSREYNQRTFHFQVFLRCGFLFKKEPKIFWIYGVVIFLAIQKTPIVFSAFLKKNPGRTLQKKNSTNHFRHWELHLNSLVSSFVSLGNPMLLKSRPFTSLVFQAPEPPPESLM